MKTNKMRKREKVKWTDPVTRKERVGILQERDFVTDAAKAHKKEREEMREEFFKRFTYGGKTGIVAIEKSSFEVWNWCSGKDRNYK
jgi:DNA-binding helix-hairpin-helix protein with protein kinase domain